MPTKEDYQKFKEFLVKYEKYYDKQLIDFIKANFENGFHCAEIKDILKQVYAYLDILPEERNVYKKCLDIIIEEYGLENNILEIGCGALPILSMYIDEKQTNGTITAYDNRLVLNKLGNIKLYKRNFTMDDDIKNYELVVGVYPCEASVLMIEKASKENKDMFLLACDCTHFSTNYLQFNIPELYDWHNFLYNKSRIGYEGKKELIQKEITIESNRPKMLLYTKK